MGSRTCHARGAHQRTAEAAPEAAGASADREHGHPAAEGESLPETGSSARPRHCAESQHDHRLNGPNAVCHQPVWLRDGDGDDCLFATTSGSAHQRQLAHPVAHALFRRPRKAKNE